MMSLTQIDRRKKCVNTPRPEKGAHKRNENPKHLSGQHKYTNKQANEVCEYFSFLKKGGHKHSHKCKERTHVQYTRSKKDAR